MYPWSADRASCLNFINENGYYLKEFPLFQNDYEIVIKALKNNPSAIQFVGDEFKENPEIIDLVIPKCGLGIEYLSDNIKNDKAIVLTAVKQNGWALYHVSNTLKDDRDVVLTAIQQNGMALQYASTRLIHDEELCFICVSKEEFSFNFIPKIYQDKLQKCFEKNSCKTYQEAASHLLEKWISFEQEKSMKGIDNLNQKVEKPIML